VPVLVLHLYQRANHCADHSRPNRNPDHKCTNNRADDLEPNRGPNLCANKSSVVFDTDRYPNGCSYCATYLIEPHCKR